MAKGKGRGDVVGVVPAVAHQQALVVVCLGRVDARVWKVRGDGKG